MKGLKLEYTHDSNWTTRFLRVGLKNWIYRYGKSFNKQMSKKVSFYYFQNNDYLTIFAVNWEFKSKGLSLEINILNLEVIYYLNCVIIFMKSFVFS